MRTRYLYQIRVASYKAISFSYECTGHAAVLAWTTLGTFAGGRIAIDGQAIPPSSSEPISLTLLILGAGEWSGLPICVLRS